MSIISREQIKSLTLTICSKLYTDKCTATIVIADPENDDDELFVQKTNGDKDNCTIEALKLSHNHEPMTDIDKLAYIIKKRLKVEAAKGGDMMKIYNEEEKKFKQVCGTDNVVMAEAFPRRDTSTQFTKFD